MSSCFCGVPIATKVGLTSANGSGMAEQEDV